MRTFIEPLITVVLNCIWCSIYVAGSYIFHCTDLLLTLVSIFHFVMSLSYIFTVIYAICLHLILPKLYIFAKNINIEPCCSSPNRAWLLVGRPQSGRWVLPEWLWYTRLVTMELNGNKNQRATFYAFFVDYDIIISGYSLYIILYV